MFIEDVQKAEKAIPRRPEHDNDDQQKHSAMQAVPARHRKRATARRSSGTSKDRNFFCNYTSSCHVTPEEVHPNSALGCACLESGKASVATASKTRKSANRSNEDDLNDLGAEYLNLDNTTQAPEQREDEDDVE